MVCISAEIAVAAVVGSLEEKIGSCLIQNGIQIIIVIGGKYPELLGDLLFRGTLFV